MTSFPREVHATEQQARLEDFKHLKVRVRMNTKAVRTTLRVIADLPGPVDLGLIRVDMAWVLHIRGEDWRVLAPQLRALGMNFDASR